MKGLTFHMPANGLLQSMIPAVVFYFLTAVSAYTATCGHASPPDCQGSTSPKAAAAEEKFLVLHAGQVLKGRISLAGDRYKVELPYGEITIGAGEVESCCRNLDEAYHMKRSLIHSGDFLGHVALAEWCMQNNLPDAAAAELSAAAAASDEQNPKVVYLRRRLEAASHPPTINETSPDSKQAMPARSELDRLAKSMPPGAMETFTDTIQPLLLNSCSTHECHGPQSQTRFRLLRAHPGHSPGRRLTQRNLYAAMEWIDRKNPQASPLLTKPIEPHGLKNSVIFDDTNARQYRRLVHWVAAVVRDRKMQDLSRTEVSNPRDLPAKAPVQSADRHSMPITDWK